MPLTDAVFVDTSALLSLLDGDEDNHQRATQRWRDLLIRNVDLQTSSYVWVETTALAQRRLGLDAVRSLADSFRPLIRTFWVGEDEHDRAQLALVSANRRQLSLVDCVSFVVMRRAGIRQCFAYDRHFEEQGFQMLD